MNKQSVIVTKWFNNSNTLLKEYSELSLLLSLVDPDQVEHDYGEVLKAIKNIESMIANSDVGTKWTLTLEKVEQ